MNKAEAMLKRFVQQYGALYDYKYVNYNGHNLIHLSQDVMKFGSLDNFNAFRPESYMFHLKQKICLHSGKPLQ